MKRNRDREGEKMGGHPVELLEVNVAEGNMLMLRMAHAVNGDELVLAIHQADFIALANAIEEIRKNHPEMFVLEADHLKWGKYSFDQERN